MTTTNPYYDFLRQLPAFGRLDPKVPSYLAEVTLDSEEAVIASVACNHGQGRVGHLVITTTRLRWFQRLLIRTHDHWPLEMTMVLRRAMPPVIELASGELFQGRGVSSRPFKQFVGLHQQMVEAMRWDIEHAQPQPVSVVLAGLEPQVIRALGRSA